VRADVKTISFLLFIVVHGALLGRGSFCADTGMHAEQFKIVNVENNEELASVGS
jgi:hypothetical protein